MDDLTQFRQLFPEYGDIPDDQLIQRIQAFTPEQTQAVEQRRTQGAQPGAAPGTPGGLELATAEGWATEPERMQQLQAALRQQMGYPEPQPLEDPNAPANAGRFLPATGPGQFVRSAFQGATLGWGDEIVGALGGNTEFERRRLGEHRAADPVGAGGAEMLGGLLPGFIPAVGAARGATLGAQAVRGALGSGALGATYGAGAAEPGERVQGALNAVGPSAAIGGALPFVARGAANVLMPGQAAGTAARAALPTVDDLRTAAQAAYQQAEQAGLVIAGDAYDDVMIDLMDTVRRAGFDEQLHPRANAALTRLLTEADGQPLTLQDVDILRRVVQGAARSLEPDEQRIAGIIQDAVDDFLENLDPAQVMAGDAQLGVAALQEARGLWARMRKTETLEDLENRARNAVGANYTQAGLETATRQQFRALANNKRAMDRFSPEEQEAILDIVRGGPIQNALRRLGAFAPTGFFGGAFGALGAMNLEPGMMALTTAGSVARAGSRAMNNSSVNRLQAMVRTGQPVPVLSQRANPLALFLLEQANAAEMPRLLEGTAPQR